MIIFRIGNASEALCLKVSEAATQAMAELHEILNPLLAEGIKICSVRMDFARPQVIRILAHLQADPSEWVELSITSEQELLEVIGQVVLDSPLLRAMVTKPEGTA